MHAASLAKRIQWMDQLREVYSQALSVDLIEELLPDPLQVNLIGKRAWEGAAALARCALRAFTGLYSSSRQKRLYVWVDLDERPQFC